MQVVVMVIGCVVKVATIVDCSNFGCRFHVCVPPKAARDAKPKKLQTSGSLTRTQVKDHPVCATS